MWVPFVQMVFPFAKSKRLKGAFIPHAKPLFSDTSWLAGNFQRNYELYLNDTIGFYQDFICVRNQIDFSLFRKCHSYDIEVGKNDYLIATTHIDAHLGKLHTRLSKIDSTSKMLKQLNDTLIKLNKTLIVIFAPSRGAFYKDLAPSWYDMTPQHESDYQAYNRLLNNTGVKILDFNKSFLEKKASSPYPLFTKCGIHWSIYGAAVAGDSMARFIEKERKQDLPDIRFDRIVVSDTARSTDADLNSTLNLIWDVKNEPMAYPVLSFNKKDKAKLNALFIGDSFFFTFGITYIPEGIFNEYSFWYYNKTVFSKDSTNGKTASELNLAGEINKRDVIALIATETNLTDLGWGFIEKAWNHYYSSSSQISSSPNQMKK